MYEPHIMEAPLKYLKPQDWSQMSESRTGQMQPILLMQIKLFLGKCLNLCSINFWPTLFKLKFYNSKVWHFNIYIQTDRKIIVKYIQQENCFYISAWKVVGCTVFRTCSPCTWFARIICLSFGSSIALSFISNLVMVHTSN